MFAVFLIASLLCSVHANWYGKRGDSDDFYNLLMQHRLERASHEVNSDVALAAIDQILQLYRQRKAENPMATQLKQGA